MSTRQDNVLINERIRVSPVRVIRDNENMGIMNTNEAIKLAKSFGLELVQISDGRPPICRIMDFGKYKYEQNLKLRQQKKNSKTAQLKEIRLKPAIGNHDLEIKIRSILNFLEEKHPVNISLKFKARENTHKEIGYKIMNEIVAKIDKVGKIRGGKINSQGNTISFIAEPL